MKKAIIFKGENIAKINEAIREAEGQARVSLLDYNKLYTAIQNFNRRFNLRTYCAVFTLEDLEGTVIHIASETGSYMGRKASKYTKMATVATMHFHGGKWYLSDVERAEAPKYALAIEFSDTAKEAIVRSNSFYYTF